MTVQTAERSCPACGKNYREGLRCPDDGTALVMVSADRTDAFVGLEIDGRYTIRERLGQGGMGTVYRAWQHSVGREIALKVMSAPDPDGTLTKRFMREANLLGQLNQPGIVSMLDFGQMPGGQLYLTMELVDGDTLSALIRQEGPMPFARVKRIGVQLCDVLEAAHHRGIVHRDLKPANVMVLKNPPGRDHIKVLDFGLARSLSDPERLTESGQVMGSAQFMAPELVAGEDATPQSDLYAVGAILYALANARLPFGRPANFTEAARRQVVGQVEPMVPGLPATLERLILKLMEIEPERRPKSAALVREMLTEIDELGVAPVADPPSIPSVPSAPSAPLVQRSRALPIGLGLGALALISAAIVVAIGKPDQEHPVIVVHPALDASVPAPLPPPVPVVIDAGAPPIVDAGGPPVDAGTPTKKKVGPRNDLTPQWIQTGPTKKSP